MNHEIVPAGLEHAIALAPRLRKGDLAEIKAASGENPEDVLVFSMAMSTLCWAWLYKGKVMALFGVVEWPGRPGVGIPWLLCAKGVERHKVFFMRHSKPYQELMLDAFPFLENWVDCRNTPSIQWLHWCGFALAEVNPFYGAQRLPFIRFIKARRPRDV
jgi:hypothetical protein